MKILHKITKNVLKEIEGETLRGADLSGADLSGAELVTGWICERKK